MYPQDFKHTQHTLKNQRSSTLSMCVEYFNKYLTNTLVYPSKIFTHKSSLMLSFNLTGGEQSKILIYYCY